MKTRRQRAKPMDHALTLHEFIWTIIIIIGIVGFILHQKGI